MRDPLLKWRKEFPILASSTYLISNSLGAMPKGVYGRMEQYAETWARRGVRAWEETWWEMSSDVGDLIAPLIGARAGEVTMHLNTSLLQAMLISCFDFTRKRNTVLFSDLEFPSAMYVYRQLARAEGARLKIVRSNDGISVPAEKLLKAIDERTLIVLVSHVLFKSAQIQDVRAIAEKAHACGAIVVVDAYHSVGIIPVDVRRMGADILVGGVLKWLCGGPGGAFLWVRPSLRKRLKPKVTGWLAHRDPFAFEQEMRYSPGGRRFLNGTPPIPALYAATEGPRILLSVGMQAIREKSQRQTSLLIERAQQSGYGIMSPLNAEERGGTVTLAVPHAYEVSRELLRRDIMVDYRKGAGIRIAPHFYNSDGEVLRAVDEIGSILASGVRRVPARRRSTVT